jgi:hypothetical protein
MGKIILSTIGSTFVFHLGNKTTEFEIVLTEGSPDSYLSSEFNVTVTQVSKTKLSEVILHVCIPIFEMIETETL